MMMTKQQAEIITELVRTVRGDWDAQGVMAALANCRHRDVAEIARAAVRAAAMPTNRTPAVIAMDGDHWQARTLATVGPVRREDMCTIHDGGYRDRCAGCAADSKALKETNQ